MTLNLDSRVLPLDDLPFPSELLPPFLEHRCSEEQAVHGAQSQFLFEIDILKLVLEQSGDGPGGLGTCSGAFLDHERRVLVEQPRQSLWIDTIYGTGNSEETYRGRFGLSPGPISWRKRGLI